MPDFRYGKCNYCLLLELPSIYAGKNLVRPNLAIFVILRTRHFAFAIPVSLAHLSFLRLRVIRSSVPGSPSSTILCVPVLCYFSIHAMNVTTRQCVLTASASMCIISLCAGDIVRTSSQFSVTVLSADFLFVAALFGEGQCVCCLNVKSDYVLDIC